MESISIKQKIAKSPATRIILGLFLCLSAVVIGQQLFLKILGVGLLSTDLRNFTKGIAVSILLIGSYIFFHHK